MLFRASDLAIWIDHAVAYPQGVCFEMQIRWRSPRRAGPPFLPGAGGRQGLCLGLAGDDGLLVLATRLTDRSTAPPPSHRPALLALRARHGADRASVALWLWSVLDQPLSWVFEWRVQRVPEMRVPLDVSALQEAARSALPLWEAPSAGPAPPHARRQPNR